jgi:hypothetical protein
LADNSPLAPTQQHVQRLAQNCKFAFIVHDNGLDAGAPGNEPLRPRLAAARIRLDQKAGINQRDASRFAEL